MVNSNGAFETSDRCPSSYRSFDTFALPKGASRAYQQQFADMYFARLAQIKPAVEKAAVEAWTGFEVGWDDLHISQIVDRARQIGGVQVHQRERVLDVRQGELCWITGTVFMDMPLKPNVLDDLATEVRLSWIP